MEEKNTQTPEVPAPSPEKEALEKDEKKLRRMNRSVRAYQNLLLRLAALAIGVWLLLYVFVGLTRMPSEFMSPNVKVGDMVLFYRLEKQIRAQDVVVAEITGEDGKREQYVLRVVAMPGDTVDIRSGALIVNGSAMVESNVYTRTDTYEGFDNLPVTLGEDQYYLLADKREGATDSRVFGPVDRSNIAGTVITILRRNGI